MDEIMIHIFKSDDGFMYDIYDGLDTQNIIDGGLCTTTFKNALEMASEQVKQLAKNK